MTAALFLALPALAADLDHNGVDDAREVIGGPELETFAPAVLEVVMCDWDLAGPVNLTNPWCYPLTIELHQDHTTEYTADYGWVWDEGVDAEGSRTFEFEVISQRMRGVRVPPASAQVCYEGYVDALGGVTYTNGTHGQYWFPTGRWSGCVY
jgi:hypothetical protein